jgi:hypothetical protein
LESDSNEIDERNSQLEKQSEPRISTLCGIIINRNEEHENALDSIRFNLEPDSNEIDERNSQYEKQPEPRISTVCGITIDCNKECENPLDLISLTGNSRPRHTITQRR